MLHVVHRMQSTLKDRAYQILYRVGFRAMRVYWRLLKPHTSGTGVLLRFHDEILLIENSYKKGLSLPGGAIKSDERPAAAARRELYEEVGVRCSEDDLMAIYDFEWRVDNKRDQVVLFELTCQERPEIAIDHREVVWAGWFELAEALEQPIPRHLRSLLARRSSGKGNTRQVEA